MTRKRVIFPEAEGRGKYDPLLVTHRPEQSARSVAESAFFYLLRMHEHTLKMNIHEFGHELFERHFLLNGL